MPKTIVKAVVLGDIGVGKSTLFNKLHLIKENLPLDTAVVNSTIGVSFVPISLSSEVKLWTWEISGEDWCKQFIQKYTEDADIIFIIYDITSEDSFTAAMQLLAWSNINYKQLLVIIGNKTDKQLMRRVCYDRAQQVADHFDGFFYEISAKTTKIRSLEVILKEACNSALKLKQDTQFTDIADDTVCNLCVIL